MVTRGGSRTKPSSLVLKEAERDLVGKTCYDSKHTIKSGKLRESRAASSRNHFVRVHSTLAEEFKLDEKPREKNQVLLTFNCNKAIPTEGYNMLCDLLEPWKSKLQQKSRQT